MSELNVRIKEDKIFWMKNTGLNKLVIDGSINRSINDTHKKNLQKKINTTNYISPILVDEDLIVLDGQHRLKVAESLSMDIPYFIVSNVPKDKELRIAYISSLQKAKAWLPGDFIENNTKLSQIQDLMDTYDLLNMDSAYIFMYYGTGYKQEDIKDSTVDVPVIDKEHIAKAGDVVRSIKVLSRDVFNLKSSRVKTAIMESIIKKIGIDNFLSHSDEFVGALCKKGLYLDGYTINDINHNSLAEIRDSVVMHFYDMFEEVA